LLIGDRKIWDVGRRKTVTIGPTYETLGPHLADSVPELREPYEALRHEWEDDTPGAHVVFGDVLNPLLLRLLTATEPTEAQEALLRRIFSYLELLAQSEDTRVQEVVWATVAERLGDDPRVLAAARRYMGQATRRLSDDIERFWDRTRPGSGATTPATALATVGQDDRRFEPE
jgi:hypothetical protein